MQLEKLGIYDRPPRTTDSPTLTNCGGLPKIAPGNCFAPKICPEVGYLRNLAGTQLKGGNWTIELSKQKLPAFSRNQAVSACGLETEKVRACGAIPKGIARRAIVAAARGKPHLPAWVNQIQTQHPAERIHHSHQVDLRNLQLHGKQTLIVGGGLTSGHLAIG
ncbi:hypothetical protein [Microcoleus sp. AR_TQ3_B6]|uniref:hypothetical protein n=1 Tax=Microcoleus sp. AR_TQ3_B6 TaxID=3055284 RepID=UPI002FD0650D